MTITIEHLFNLHRIGFPIVGLCADSMTATYQYAKGNPPIFNNPEFWNLDKIKAFYRQNKFVNVATVLGKSHIKDIQGDYLWITGLDIDCKVANRILSIPISELIRLHNAPSEMIETFCWGAGISDFEKYSLLDVLKQVTYVTKTHKSYGNHVYWFSHFCYANVITNYCKKGCEFELSTGASAKLMHLPNSVHREHKDFTYGAVGRTDKIVQSDDLYAIFTQLFKNLLVNEKLPEHEEAAGESEDSDEYEEGVDIDFWTLSDKAVNESIQYLIPYYQQGDRQAFTLPFGGLANRNSIDIKSARAIIVGLCKETDDVETKSRIRAIKDTYARARKSKRVTATGFDFQENTHQFLLQLPW